MKRTVAFFLFVALVTAAWFHDPKNFAGLWKQLSHDARVAYQDLRVQPEEEGQTVSTRRHGALAKEHANE
jgi:hypothetical protein